MTMFIAGLLVFLGTHLLRVLAPDFRQAMIARLGILGWKAVYSVIALAGFVALVLGYAEIRLGSSLLWGPPAPWMRMATGLLMLPALVVFVAAYLPGKIRASLRHPMLIATAVWAVSHLAVNGRLADLALFGSFLGWSLVVLADSFRRPVPTPARKTPSLLWDGVAIAVGGGAWWWLAFGGGHLLLFGVPVM